MKHIVCLFLALSFLEANYFLEASKYYQIPPELLWAIAKKESNFNPNAKNINSNDTEDIGIMQINSIHLKELWQKYKITKQDLLNPKLNIFIGAMILQRCLKKHRNNLQNGITCYNGRVKNNSYGSEVMKILGK